MQRKCRCGISLILLTICLVMCGLFSIPNLTANAVEKEVDVRIHFIDVGQGDSIFIELPDGKTMLIDGGLEKQGKNVAKYIKNLGYTKIDYMVATHADADHIGGLITILEKFDVETIYRPFTISTCTTNLNYTDELFIKFEESLSLYSTCADAVYAKFLKAAYAEKINGVPSTIKVCSDKEDILSSDNENPFMIEFFLPFAGYEFSTDRIEKGYTTAYNEDTNDSSALILLSMEDKSSYLFAGDVTTQNEKTLMDRLSSAERERLASVTLLKVSHHGSDTSSCVEFLSVVNPSHAVIMVGEGNQYGLPSTSVINNLEYFGTKIYRTDKLGTIVVEEIAGVLYFNNIETKTFFENYQWLFYLILGLILVGLVLLIYLYPRFKKEEKGKNKIKFWQKKGGQVKTSKFSEGPEDKNFS